MKTSVIAASLAALLVSFGASAASGGGVVNFKGTVIDAPCGITADSSDQSIDFGQISKTQLSSGGTSVVQPVKIKLVNCDAAKTTKGVQVTFSGNTVGGTATELLTAGSTGTAVVMSGYGKPVSFGTATDAITLVGGNNTLSFDSWVKQATGGTVAEGDFTATANFGMTYP